MHLSVMPLSLTISAEEPGHALEDPVTHDTCADGTHTYLQYPFGSLMSNQDEYSQSKRARSALKASSLPDPQALMSTHNKPHKEGKG